MLYHHAIWDVSSVVCMASTFNYMLGISSYLFSLWFCLDSQSVMKIFGPGFMWFLLCTGVFWGEFVIFSEIALLHLSSRLLLTVWDLWLYSPLSQSSSDGTSWTHVVFLVPPFQCCCIFFLHLTGYCLQMWRDWISCCLVLCLLGSLYHFWFVVG